MSEKRGLQDQSLKNDYNTAGVLEVLQKEWQFFQKGIE